MPRRKFRHSQRFESPGDRSHQEYILNQPAQLTTRTELLRLIRGGEDTYLELKVKLSNSERIAQGIVALANTGGGTIIFGVSDQLRIEGVTDPDSVRDELARICREEIVPPLIPMIDCISFDSGKRIVVLDVDPRKRPYRTRDGRFYMRFGAEKREVAREQLSMWLDEIRPLGYENIPLFNGVESDFDDGLLWAFASAFDEVNQNISLYQTAEFLKKDLLLAVGNGDEFFPTVAALMLFGKNERIVELFPRSGITISRVSGENGNAQLIEKIELQGNLLTQFDSIVRFIQRYCDLLKDKPRKTESLGNSPVRPRSSYNYYAIREAIANTLVHRDLAFRDIPTRILIYDNSIEFANARRTNGFVPPASRAIRYGITQRLNPQIAAVFNRREYGANVPLGGLPMILKEAEKFSGRRAEIYTSNDEFKLKIYGI
ncbi:MAG: RNA-binding domain-containing protein [Pyrinomonadaceae bacterium]|nr:putative DNA binding domain-containing protein [Blastocatellia bacterium]MDQ3221003.1 putative DNA binding domain-containing protein [Acidobacteriota bacterium]MDQ3491362.1 putative DNA binding domain-containing protein [Acidobacteriota bacterium]